jgi:hypothetical protein
MYIISLFMEFILEKIVFLTPNNSIVHFRKLSHIISIKSFLIVKVYLAGRAPSKGLFRWWKSLGKVPVAFFVVIWQNLSNYRLTRLKRFVSTFTDKLYN